MKISEQLRVSKNLILTPDKWNQGGFIGGSQILGTERICASEALNRGFVLTSHKDISTAPYPYLRSDAYETFCRANQLRQLGVAEFNDSHTHEEVLQAFDKAITLAEQENQ
jgi:hypothetical protein